ncbi:MAG: hypothetical protein HWN80_15885, partial [Candidatus Lokiarchaeota archaeon]|nr:hypothetical protein [Candidatus Lokiarchaeota archaeon]
SVVIHASDGVEAINVLACDYVVFMHMKLFQEQYVLFGYDKANPLHMPARLTLYSAARIVYEYDNHKYFNGLNIREFSEAVKIDIYSKDFNKGSYIPRINTWDINTKLKTYLESINAPDNEIQDILELIKPCNDRLLHKIDIEWKSRDLFKGLPNTKRVDLIKRIVNCPDTDVLKMIESFASLSKILFNNPDLDQKGGYRYDQGNHISKVVFGVSIESDRVSTVIFPLMTRAIQLEISDFEAIGLEQEINPEELILLKNHIFKTIEQFLRDYGDISSGGSKKFKDPLLNKLLYKAIEKMHIATAIHKNDNFLSHKVGAEVLNILTGYFPVKNMFQQDSINEAINSLYDFIKDALYRGKRSTYPSMKEMQIYYDAIKSLDDLSQGLDFVQTIWRINARSNTYSKLWSDSKYKAWNVITQLQDLFGTELLSFESLDELIFDKKTGKFISHHIDPDGKASLALYDQILTNADYHNTYATMPIASQKILKEGVRKLIQMGIDGKGSGRNGYINEDDIRKVFYGEVFSVRSRKTGADEINIPILSEYIIDSTGRKTLVSNPGLWDYHFSDVDFNQKLTDFNDKIERFRDTVQQTGSQKQAYMAMLSFKYQIALTRFYNDAGEFVNLMKMGSVLKPNDPNYMKLSDFGTYQHLYFTKILYRITIPLDSF